MSAGVSRRGIADLGAEIAARVGDGYGTRASLARDCGVTGAMVSDVLRGAKSPSGSLVVRIAAAVGADGATRDRWCAMAQRVEPGLLGALLAAPERWDEVRALLAAGGGR